MPFGYPVSLELSGRQAVVIGQDAVAQGKVDGLLAAGAATKVVARGPAPALQRLESNPDVQVLRRTFRAGDLEGAFICVASSRDPATRAAIFQEARALGVLVNVMDDPPHCDFAAPAVVRRGDLVISVSTGGRSPALARRLRMELEKRFGPEWAEVLDLIGEVRAETLSQLQDLAERSRRWENALDVGELEALITAGRRDDARERLLSRLVRGEPA